MIGIGSGAMDKYDVIVIGAGNAGLVAALTLQKKGKKVLILERGRMSGGFSSSFVRGRFEFDASLHELCGYGTIDNPGEILKLFERLQIKEKVHMESIPETFHVISLEDKCEYTMPTGVENFISKMEEYVSGSKESMEVFFQLCTLIKEVFSYIKEQGKSLNIDKLMELYPDFVQIAPCSVKEVLESIHMPKKAIEILSTYWVYLGSPISTLSFIHYAQMVDSYVRYAPSVPKNTSYELSCTLEETFKSLGGTIRYLSEVEEILVSNEKVYGVTTKNKEYLCEHVIANISPSVVYKNLIKKEKVPKNAMALHNKHTLGARGICVYLGLNKTVEELGLKHYTYFITHSMDSDKEAKRMHELYNGYVCGVVSNNAFEDKKNEPTKIMLTSLLFGDDFNKTVNENNYFEIKEKLAKTLITTFEEGTNVKISDYIEEIEVATPLTFARYTGHPDGTIYGYMAESLDNLFPRIVNEERENYIKGLRFCGGFASRLSGYSSTYLNGEEVALKTYMECEKNEY